MSRRFGSLLTLLAMVAFLAAPWACKGNGEENGNTERGNEAAEPQGGGTNTGGGSSGTGHSGTEGYVDDYEDSDAFFTFMKGMVKGDSPHGTVQVWYSAKAKEDIENKNYPVPEGTVSIKPSDQDHDGTVDVIAVMVKKGEDYDPENNNWYYEMRNAEGELLDEPPAGRIQSCIDCHKMGRKTDYLMGTEMR